MKRNIATAIALLFCLAANADEGMWMINAINSALEKKMQERGLALSARDIYDADAEGATISDAIVSLEFSCTGSIISDNGLLITNHHCAFSDVFGISTSEHNYLEDGFWAMDSGQERCIEGKKAFFLKKVIDITDEVEAFIEDSKAQGQAIGMRKLGYMMEKKYSEEYGLEAWFSSMWKGSRYYIALYQVFRDIRLVAAPPVSMAAFGGDIDNWEWPQHKCDFALYRVYTAPDGSPADYSEQNIPLRPVKKLDISLKGVNPGDFTMVIGFPGRTDRYSSSSDVDFSERVSLPISNEIRAGQMAIVNSWMNSDPAIRLKYSDYYFGLSNLQELNEGQVLCYRRFRTAAHRREQEEKMQEWIDSDPGRQEKWGNLIETISEKSKASEEIRRNTVIYRETIVRGTNISRYATRIGSLQNSRNGMETAQKRLPGIINGIREDFGKYDMRVEKDLFTYSFCKYFSQLAPQWFGPYQKDLIRQICCHDSSCEIFNPQRQAGRIRQLAEEIWEQSFLTDQERFEEFTQSHTSLEDYLDDPIVRFLNDRKITDFNKAKEKAMEGHDLATLEKEYAHVLYQMRKENGIEQYPDANSTMRITYGTVGGIEPYDAVICSWQSTARGLLEKHDPASYEFCLNERQKQLLEAEEWSSWGADCLQDKGIGGGLPKRYMPVDFLTDNDITGGNSGSPVLNAHGELVGLAFDGNKESLAGDSMYVEGYNKCVCVDIRFILWTLDCYAGMDRIIEELMSLPR